ncbi:MAG: ankyrin repeat domain-containing protein [Bacteroides sp.]|nr:ankyrin repeat domain-containing protein [Prevotella sp.]MCM1408699.1 ankyrin repeat domain-containing protein [Treponema brennaborense]MCM1470560.1 ankyrin repeat domain-containing protein [Bacteroides sp.]
MKMFSSVKTAAAALALFSQLTLSCVSVPQEKTIQQMILEGHGNEAKDLFDIKVDINAADSEGNTPLHAAAQINDADLITFLIYRGANTEVRNNEGDTPLHVALKYNCKDAVRVLAGVNGNIFARNAEKQTVFALALEKGADYYNSLITTKTGDMTDEQGRTIVHYLVAAEHSAGIDLCIQRKIPLSVADKNGIMPVDLAYRNSGSVASIRIAAALLMANAIPSRGTFSFFEDAIKTRNPSLRFEDGQTPLHFAAIMKQKGITEYLLERGASTKAKDILGSTPLHEAVRYGAKEIVRILLKAGADPNSQDSLGKTPLLLIAPQDTRADIYNLLLAAGANPNTKDMYGDTPLHIATMNGMDLAILQKLKDSGADINERNKRGITPLALAVNKKLKDHVNFYARCGADIHAEDTEGNTPLSRVFGAGADKTDMEILSILIDERNIASRDSYGNTPLHIAVTHNASPQQVKYLLQFPYDIDARNKNGDSALYLAVKNDRRAIGELFLAKNADVFSANTENSSPLRLALTAGGETQEWLLTSEVIKAADGIGNTPLHYAAEWHFDNAAALLLEKGANPNAQNANGETPLYNAIESDSASTIALLIAKGADKNARDYLGNTPLHACVRQDAQTAAKALLLAGADINAQNLAGKTPLAAAARLGHIAMTTLLLDNGADINAADATGKTVLMDSIQSVNTEIATLLIKRGASPLIQEMYGRNAYHEAVSSGNLDLIQLVRNAGGNPLSRDAHGVTPFSLALNKNSAILDAVTGNNVNLSDSDGNTPLHIAVEYRASANALRQLINKHYPLNARNRNGITALTIAVQTGQLELTRLLLENGADPFILDNAGNCAVTLGITENPEILPDLIKIAGNKTDMAGDTILHYAARISDEEIIKKLLAMGLNRAVRNISGETPYDIAVRWQKTATAELLR